MRAIFSILSLLVVVAVVGMLAKKQLGTVSDLHPTQANSNSVALPVTNPGATVQQQSLDVQQQVKKSLEAALQQPRAEPDDK